MIAHLADLPDLADDDNETTAAEQLIDEAMMTLALMGIGPDEIRVLDSDGTAFDLY